MNNKKKNRFMSWGDLIITPSVEIAILVVSVFITWTFHRRFGLSLFAKVILFYFAQVIITLLALKIIRFLFPLKDGVYSYRNNPLHCYIWNLQTFLYVTNLFLLYDNIHLPSPLRTIFYKLLGCKVGKGIMPISGTVFEPYLVSIEENVQIGQDALITPHVVIPPDILVIGRIMLKNSAVIGVKSVIMPGVTIGENSMVNAMSLVAMGTKIPPNEVWGGNPAKKIRDIPQV